MWIITPIGNNNPRLVYKNLDDLFAMSLVRIAVLTLIASLLFSLGCYLIASKLKSSVNFL
jgi:hypothetical protein